MLVGKVADTFAIKDRGLVVATDSTYEGLPRDFKLKVGDAIELRTGNQVVLRTQVAGLELGGWMPQRPFTFLLPKEVCKEDVPVNCEVWTVDPAERSA